MGGINEATCVPPSSQSVSSDLGINQSNPIRFHENKQEGEVHFHDDQSGIKCAIDSVLFFERYHKWRSELCNELRLFGHDGSGGYSLLRIVPYIDDHGLIQVSMEVSQASVGQTISDLDKLASYP